MKPVAVRRPSRLNRRDSSATSAYGSGRVAFAVRWSRGCALAGWGLCRRVLWSGGVCCGLPRCGASRSFAAVGWRLRLGVPPAVSGPNYTKFCGILSRFVPVKLDKIQILCNSGPFASWSCCRGVCVRPASLAVAPWALRWFQIDRAADQVRTLATCQGYENNRRGNYFLDPFGATLTERIPGGASRPPTDSDTPNRSAPRRVPIVPPGNVSGGSAPTNLSASGSRYTHSIPESELPERNAARNPTYPLSESEQLRTHATITPFCLFDLVRKPTKISCTFRASHGSQKRIDTL